ncbi:D-alanine--D-alanine ligase [Elusimicrobiota bacterium]
MDIQNWIKDKKIAVLYGGTSAEREISVESGRSVIKALKESGCDVVEIDVGVDIFLKLKEQRVDFAYIALHGTNGEDGTVQGLLELLNIPYSGCGVLSSALCMDKFYSKMILKANKIATPEWILLNEQSKKKCLLKFPLVVKPVAQGSAIGISIAENSKNFSEALENAFKIGTRILVEKYISGTEVTVAVLGSEALPVIEIVPANKFYDFDSKYTAGKSQHIIPARLPKKVLSSIKLLGLKVFKLFNCKALARIDMIVDKKNKPWVLEVNTIPGMTETSLLPDAAKAAGISFNELVLKIMEYSLR